MTAQEIIAELKKTGFTLAEIGRQIGVPKEMIWAWGKGGNPRNQKHFAALQTLLKTEKAKQ